MTSPSPYAANSAGVKVAKIDFSKPNAPTTMMYHGGTIVANGKIIGRINNWQPAGAYTREATHIYEVNKETWGLPIDIVPGRATGFNVTFVRTEVWSQELEIALGYGATWSNLTDQNYPFTAMEYLFKGDTVYRSYSYLGCWMTEKNPEAWASDGDGVFKVSCNMMYISRVKTT